MRLLAGAGAGVVVEGPVRWSWSGGMRPYAVPSRLWRLPVADAVGVFEPGVGVWWSGVEGRRFDLGDRRQRLRAYEVVLREGTPADIEGVVDGALLVDAWDDLVLPASLRGAWQSLVEAARGGLARAS